LSSRLKNPTGGCRQGERAAAAALPDNLAGVEILAASAADPYVLLHLSNGSAAILVGSLETGLSNPTKPLLHLFTFGKWHCSHPGRQSRNRFVKPYRNPTTSLHLSKRAVQPTSAASKQVRQTIQKPYYVLLHLSSGSAAILLGSRETGLSNPTETLLHFSTFRKRQCSHPAWQPYNMSAKPPMFKQLLRMSPHSCLATF